MKDEARAEHPGHADTKPPAYHQEDSTAAKVPQWAMVPEWIVRLPLNLTDLKVYIVLSAKADRDRRIAWIGQEAIAAKIGKSRQTVSKSIRHLEKHDVIQPKGSKTVNRELGTWVRRYLVAPYPSDLPVAIPARASVSRATKADVNFLRPDVKFPGPDATPEVYTFRPSVSDPPNSNPPARSVENEDREPKTEPQELAEEERCPRCPNCLPSWHRMWHREHAGKGEA